MSATWRNVTWCNKTSVSHTVVNMTEGTQKETNNELSKTLSDLKNHGAAVCPSCVASVHPCNGEREEKWCAPARQAHQEVTVEEHTHAHMCKRKDDIETIMECGSLWPFELLMECGSLGPFKPLTEWASLRPFLWQ